MSLTSTAKDGAAKVVNRVHSFVYRRSGGKVGSRWVQKAPVLLLTTTGRKSGKARTAPVLYLADGDRLAIVASYGGDDRSPAWFHNLTANPDVTVEMAGTTRPMRAEVASAADKERLWPSLVEMYSGYESYQKKTERDIPVVFLSEAASA